MLDLTLGLTSVPAGPAWWPAGASFGADFAGNRYMRQGLHVAPGAAFGFSRAGSKLAAETDGRLISFGADQLARTGKGASIEASATNLLLQSQGYDQAVWQKFALSVTPNAATAPDGSMTATRILPAATNGLHRLLNGSAHFAAGTPCYMLVYLKADGIRYVYLNADASFGARIVVDLQTGGFVTGGTTPSDALVSHLADGWREVRLRGVATGSSDNLWLQINNTLNASDQSWTPDGTSGLFAWGAMASSAKGSYVATGAGSASRAADALTLDLPTGTHTLTVTFDDGSTQILTGATGPYAVPVDLNRPVIRRITAMPA